MTKDKKQPNSGSKNTVPVVLGFPSNNTSADNEEGGTLVANTKEDSSTLECKDCKGTQEVKSLFDNMKKDKKESE